MAVLVPLAQGTEEAEAVIVIDILRRASFEVIVAGLQSPIVCSRQVQLLPDRILEEIEPSRLFDLVVLPGGREGTKRMAKQKYLRRIIQHHRDYRRWIAAVCAAPLVLHVAGVLKPGQMVTGHPSIKEHLVDRYVYLNQPVVVDQGIVTSQGVGTTLDFALTLVSLLKDRDTAREIAEQICYQW